MIHPVSSVTWVDRGLIRPNDYNPNQQDELSHDLLVRSLTDDGWTQPLVVTPMRADGFHRIVDGEHRWKASGKLVEVFGTDVPCVILDRDDVHLQAATVRHNRARGAHGIEAMAAMVGRLREAGQSDEAIERLTGMTASEVKRLTTSEEAFLTFAGGRDGAMQAK